MQMDKQTENIQQDSQSMDNQTINNMYRLTKIQKDRQTKLQTDRQTKFMQRDRHMDRLINRQTDRHSEMTLVLSHFNSANNKNMKMTHGLHHIHSLKLKARQKIWTHRQTKIQTERQPNRQLWIEFITNRQIDKKFTDQWIISKERQTHKNMDRQTQKKNGRHRPVSPMHGVLMLFY